MRCDSSAPLQGGAGAAAGAGAGGAGADPLVWDSHLDDEVHHSSNR